MLISQFFISLPKEWAVYQTFQINASLGTSEFKRLFTCKTRSQVSSSLICSKTLNQQYKLSIWEMCVVDNLLGNVKIVQWQLTHCLFSSHVVSTNKEIREVNHASFRRSAVLRWTLWDSLPSLASPCPTTLATDTNVEDFFKNSAPSLLWYDRSLQSTAQMNSRLHYYSYEVLVHEFFSIQGSGEDGLSLLFMWKQ